MPGSRSLRSRIDQDGCVIIIHDRISQIVTSYPEVVYAHAFGQRPTRQLARDFTTKRIVAKKNIADSGDENFFHASSFTGSTSSVE